jgi:undecaprenyl diphosphate synthase
MGQHYRRGLLRIDQRLTRIDAWHNVAVIGRLKSRVKERVKARLRRALGSPVASEEPLAHVVVAGGTLADWTHFDQGEWNRRIGDLIEALEREGVRWLTLVPVSAGGPVDAESVSRLDATIDKALRHQRSRVEVIVRPEPDGRARFARVVGRLRTDDASRGVHSTASEQALARAVLAPAFAEPDLVVVLGPPDTLPTSLVWELAYSEIVFLDIPWSDISAEHLQVAVDDFRRRNRRFGGIDA